MKTWKPQFRFFATESGVTGGLFEQKKCREEGRQASWSDAAESANPYPPNSTEHIQWSEGFLDGLCESI